MMNTQLNSVVKFSRHNPSLMQLARPYEGAEGARKPNILSEITHLPTPTFLVDLNLRLIAGNIAGHRAIEQKTVLLRESKLCFADSGNTQLVKFATQRVASPAASDQQTTPVTERLYLKIEGQGLRAVSVSKTNIDTAYLLLSIAGDLGIESNQIVPCKRMQQFAKTFALSKCETRVIALMIQGQKPKQIAYTANISVHTVRSHLRALYAKMQVRDFNDALILAVRLLASS